MQWNEFKLVPGESSVSYSEYWNPYIFIQEVANLAKAPFFPQRKNALDIFSRN